MAARTQLLKAAYPLIQHHGFTRHTLSLAALSLPTPQEQPLNEAAVTALFGPGDSARRTLISAWLDNERAEMRDKFPKSVRDALAARLDANMPVLAQLPEAFALLATPSTSIGRFELPIPLLDPRPGLSHATAVAHEACLLTNDPSDGTSWYARRASLAAVYAASELHQLTSPHTAHAFLDSLLNASGTAKRALDNVGLFGTYFTRSWAGIIRSSGMLP